VARVYPSGEPDRCAASAVPLSLLELRLRVEKLMIRLRLLVAVAATALFAAAAYGEPTITLKEDAREAVAKPAKPTKQSGGFNQEVKHTWSEVREGTRRAGREIGAGARTFGRSVADAARAGWRNLKEAFAGSSAREGSERSG
jgi:hypothetical protein